jgi:hypothetical protein
LASSIWYVGDCFCQKEIGTFRLAHLQWTKQSYVSFQVNTRNVDFQMVPYSRLLHWGCTFAPTSWIASLPSRIQFAEVRNVTNELSARKQSCVYQ